MVPTYNRANYLRETFANMLAPNLSPEAMQIEVVDDSANKLAKTALKN
ncbi:glycosyltransferase family 2 protein [Chroococcidiopsis sp. TS-821]|nr:glycosyltransferase family 2 protein [Chroococcidiopsis sp. TS-821]